MTQFKVFLKWYQTNQILSTQKVSLYICQKMKVQMFLFLVIWKEHSFYGASIGVSESGYYTNCKCLEETGLHFPYH